MTQAAKKASAKVLYMAEAERLIIAACPRLAGRLEWADVVHGFNVGRTAAQTAERYVLSHEGKQ